MLVRFPEIGHTTRLQIEGADILLLNKIDLVNPEKIEPLEAKLREINRTAAIVRTKRCQIDPELLFGISRSRQKKVERPRHQHQPEYESFTFSSDKTFSRDCFERLVDSLPASMIRAKGFVRFVDGGHLFNFVAGRWEMEAFEAEETQLVFIGRKITAEKSTIVDALKQCEV
jgi:G3E family GTPase